MPPEMRLRVVSFPATVSRRKKSSSSSSERLFTLEVDLGQHAHEVVGRMCPFRREQLDRIGVELHGGLDGGLSGRVARALPAPGAVTLLRGPLADAS